MSRKRIIPCLDVKDGRVVKGVNFTNIRDAGGIAENARFYNDNGADEVVLLDITATSEIREGNRESISMAARELDIPLIVGGGIREIADFERVFDAGAAKAAISTAAFKEPTLISSASERFGREKVVCAIDVKRVGDGYNVLIGGGSIDTGVDAIRWAKEVERLGAGEILLTSHDSDGTKDGFDINLLRIICSEVDIPVIASGGAGRKEHFLEAFEAGASAGLAATLFHFRELDIIELKKYLREKGVEINI